MLQYPSPFAICCTSSCLSNLGLRITEIISMAKFIFSILICVIQWIFTAYVQNTEPYKSKGSWKHNNSKYTSWYYVFLLYLLCFIDFVCFFIFTNCNPIVEISWIPNLVTFIRKKISCN